MVHARSFARGAASLGLWCALSSTGCGAQRGAGDGADERVAATAARLSEGPTERLRVLTWNVWGVGGPSGAVFEQAERVRGHADGFDVVLLNEVWGSKARKQWYEALKDEFPFALTDIDGPGVDFEDSGLMVLSRLEFQMTTDLSGNQSPQTGSMNLFAPEWFEQDVEAFGGIIRYARFDEFRSGSGPDATKAKGAVIFHLQSGSRRYNVVATNLNAGEAEGAVRREQLEDIATLVNARTSPDRDEETIVAGDFGVDAVEAGAPTPLDTASPTADFLNSEYRQAVWGDLHGLPFFDAWRTTSQQDAGITSNLGRAELAGADPDAFRGPHRYDYFLVKGQRYHAPGALTWASPSAFETATGDPRCVSWVRTTLRSSSSDHFGLAMEMGPRSPHCNPAIAKVGNVDGVATAVDLAAPGASAWFYFDTPGTYTLGLGQDEAKQGLAYEVFAEDNLSRGTGALPKHGRVVELSGPACGHEATTCAFETERFFPGQKPFYVRVFSPAGRTFGRFHFYSLRHDCSSPETACELQPGAPPIAPIVPTGQTFVGHFTFHSLPVVNREVPQTITFEVSTSTALANLRLTTSRLGNSGSTPWRPSHRREHAEARGVEYELKVERSIDSAAYSIGAKTNLTWVSGAKDDLLLPLYQAFAAPPAAMKLVCQDESGADFLDDEEIAATIVADGITIAEPPLLFRNDLDAHEAMDMSRVPDFGFVNEAFVVVNELTDDVYGAPVDDTATHFFTKLDPNDARGETRQESVQLWNTTWPELKGPLMQLQYYISHGRVH